MLRELLREGTFPAWDPYVLGGIPLYQSPAAGLFSLFNLPLWILPLAYALGVSAALKLPAGGVIVPAGSHEVVWSYRVPGLRLGIVLSLLTLLGLTGAAVALRLRGRRPARR